MKIPFTVDEFFHIFEVYNLSIWPFQLVLYALAIGAVILALKGGRRTSQVVFFILTIFWTWSGLIYHIKYFSIINPMAYFFGGVFLLQGVMFFYLGVIRGQIELRFMPRVTHVLGVVLVLYSLLIYRMIGHYQGHLFPKAPTFGVPCPTTIFTFGILLFSVQRVPWYVFIIPLLWSLVGFSAATRLSVVEDYGLFIFGILAAVFLLLDHKKLFVGKRHNQTTQ
jgi:hypothetical protein